jgi:hypothetical protein
MVAVLVMVTVEIESIIIVKVSVGGEIPFVN